MTDRLPPLTALRAFDAAARHQSFAMAASELNVTPAALSFQIKSLEEHLGTPLFHRLNRAVTLTEAGRVLAPGAAEGFATLRTAWRGAQRLIDSSSLTITAGPSITAKWLAPKLFAFAQEHPEIELRFFASLKLADFDRDEVDLAIRFGQNPTDGLFSCQVLKEWLTPMMSPALAEKIQSEDPLRKAVLIHQDETAFLDPPPGWAAWFQAAGLGEMPKGGPQFSQPDHAINAAMSGAGVILGRISLAAGALSGGLLVAPFKLALESKSDYRFVCLPGAETRPQVQAFLDWILRQAKDFAPYREGKTFVSATDVTT